MKVLQLIDSLDAGGAERMAVSLANEWAQAGYDSYLCTTRKEGPLKELVSESVAYLFLNKKKAWDVRAFQKLLSWVKKEKIDVLHAHSSSFFFAYGIKVLIPNIKLIWHDHYGNSELLNERKSSWLRRCSRKFDAIIAVNMILKEWSEKTLKCSSVHYLKNFVSDLSSIPYTGEVQGNGETKIVCLANLRPQKDHHNLLKAFQILRERGKDCSLHLAGKIWNDAHYESLVAYKNAHELDKVYFYGSIKGVLSFVENHDIGVLSSQSEGLPIALLEYGMAGLPVVATDVGQVAYVLSGSGKLVPPQNAQALADALDDYMLHPDKAKKDAEKFTDHIKKEYSFHAIKEDLIRIYEGV